MWKNGCQLPYHPLQVVAVAVFLALGFAFYVFFVPFVGKKVYQYIVMGLYTPLFPLSWSFTPSTLPALMASKIDAIADVNSSKDDWSIVARVIRLWSVTMGNRSQKVDTMSSFIKSMYSSSTVRRKDTNQV